MVSFSGLDSPGVSVIIPVYKGEAWIERCLQSLAQQTLARGQFEVILVFNGPADGSIAIAQRFERLETDIRLVMLSTDAVGAPAARNRGLAEATGNYITWVDVDDLVSPEYLELMLLAAKPGRVPFAQILDVSAGGVVEASNAINDDFFRQPGPYATPSDFSRALTFMTAKLIPVEWARAVPLDSSLKSGEDVAFYGALLAKFDFELALLPAASGAIYYRQLVETSVSRGRTDRGFMVSQRLAVIKSLSDSLHSSTTKNGPVIRGYMASQASFIRRYIVENPSDGLSVVDEISKHRISDFPWKAMQQPVTELVIAYNFAPYSDTGAVVAAKRIRERGNSVDVISNSMAKVREALPENHQLSLPYVSMHAELQSPTTFAHSGSILEFVVHGIRKYEAWVQSGRKYQDLYSRAMWPASHFLAARIRMQDPRLKWRAEFSDPVRKTTDGGFRTAAIADGLAEQFISHCSSSERGILERVRDVYAWTENLPYLYADELVFTNEHQLETMLEYAPEELRQSIMRRAVVSAHPTLPRSFYELGGGTQVVEPGMINLGYFGEFYTTRGLGEIQRAVEGLPDDLCNRLLIHVFSSKPETVSTESVDVYRIHPRLSFTEFLNSLDQFDCLIVNDASTLENHPRNPYLPSKYSDYAGSKAKIWAIVEPGSVLSRKQSDYQTTIGDVGAASRILRLLLQSEPTSHD